MSLSGGKGAGKAGRRLRPQHRVQKLQQRTRVWQVQPRHPGFPRAMALRLIRALPGERPVLPPSPTWDLPRGLTPGSRRQDHTISPYAAAVSSGVN